MADEIGFVVVEYNQASKQPGLRDFTELHHDYESADRERWDLTKEAIGIGRREAYRVAQVVLVEEDE